MLLAALLLEISTHSLLREMIDLDRLTGPATYITRQFSSYDRNSHDKGGWFANDDRGHYLRQEPGEFVLAEADGPGAIVRIWSANPSGTLRIQLDGELVLEEDFKALLSGEADGFPPPFGAMRARGGNLYYPFAYAKRMKVSCSEGGHYYQVNVRSYDRGTAVTTWDPADRPALPELTIPPAGRRADSSLLAGPGIVRRMEIDLPDDADRLRQIVLAIYADGELCVWSPLGDFFGTAPGRNPVETLPLGVTGNGIGYVNYPMPFSRSLEVRLAEPAAEGGTIAADLPVRLWVDQGQRPYRFRAWWRGRTRQPTRPMSDWPVLSCRGEGRLVGCGLTVMNPIRAWWGEGDEKIYVDGESFPSTFGTGTEDYFGYAWCDTTLFTAPYHAQSRCDGPANRGYCSLLRHHLLDDIPFRESLRFDMEIWHWVETAMSYATVAYWYGPPGMDHDHLLASPAERRVIPVPEIPEVEGALEGEAFVVESATGGQAHPQDLSFTQGFSRENHMWWRDAKPGDVLTLRFLSTVEGRRPLITALTRAPDYGIVKIEVNGQLLVEALDLYDTGVVPDGERTFDNVPLRKGDNEMVVTIVGTNEKAHPKNFMFGIDYLRTPE